MSSAILSQNIKADTIPTELTAISQWLCWRAKLKDDGKIDKPPFDAKNGQAGSSTNPETWASFQVALNAYNNGNRYSGIGIALEKTGLVGVDFDHCRNPETGEIEPWALEYVKRLNSYTESSPSGTGLRVFLYGEIKNPGNKKGNIECYTSGRYLTVTGHHLEGTPRTIEHRQDEFDKFHEAVFGCVKEKKTEALPLVISDLDETEVVHRAINAKNGEDFRRLYAGDWSGYPSQSEADLAFLSLCAFWTGRDPARMESIFRASGLFRKKTDQHYSDGSTYLSRTIAKAIDGTGEIYQCRQAPGCNVQDVSKTCPGQDQDTMSVIAQPSQTPVYNLTDVGNGLRFRDMWDNVHFNSMKGAWQFYDDTHWVLDAVGKIMQFAKATAREIYAEAARERDDDHRKALVSHAARSESIPRLEAMLKAASTEDGIPVLPDQLDSNPWLLNVLNGTVDLRTGYLLPHRREDLITKLAPVVYDPQATCPRWDDFLQKIMQGNEDLINFLMQACGYALTGDTSEQVLFILYGTGANGKSVFCETISSVLGDYALTVPFSTFLIKRGDAIPNDVAMLPGARFVSASEGEQGSRLAESLVKRLTGGDKVSARHLHHEFFEFTPQFKAFLSTNHKPAVRGVDHAMWRRLRLVPFAYTVPEAERDLHLVEKLKEESSGILMWLLTGCLKWQRIGLGAPDEVLQATESYRLEMDVISDFIDECCIVQELARAPVGDLYKTYCEWAGRNGEDALTRRNLTTQLGGRGFSSIQGTGGYYYLKGLGVRANS